MGLPQGNLKIPMKIVHACAKFLVFFYIIQYNTWEGVPLLNFLLRLGIINFNGQPKITLVFQGD